MAQQSEYLPDAHVPLYPTNTIVHHFVRLMEGQSLRIFYSMREAIHEKIGTPQETQDWSQPAEWIPTRLSGEEQTLAMYLWQGSNSVVNPRHLTGVWLFASQYQLLEADAYDRLHVTEAGQDFIANALGPTVQHIDYCEGLLHLLLIISEHGPAKRSDLVPIFSEFLEQYSNYRSPRALGSSWYYRTRNLVERGLVSRSGVMYEISQEGLAYLEQVGHLIKQTGRESVTEPQTQIRRFIKEQHGQVRERMRQTLEEMNPYAVEHLVKRLLEAMEYENVEVTSPSGDGGIDIVADIEVGITPVREVVQVKRRKGNIQRRVLDELRGCLHRFEAMRGTIITTGDFSRGAQEAAFERGAAPITLIDGNRLIDFLIEYEIGVRKRNVQLIEFEPADFSEPKSETQEPFMQQD